MDEFRSKSVDILGGLSSVNSWDQYLGLGGYVQ